MYWRIFFTKIKCTHKETDASVTNSFYDPLELKTSNGKIKLVWLIWELTVQSHLKANDIGISVFNHFFWLRPLKGKSSLLVYKELKELCHEHEPPLILQCDYRKKFKGAAKRLEKRLHDGDDLQQFIPAQSQGKVEIGHIKFPSQTKYDLMQLMEHDGII